MGLRPETHAASAEASSYKCTALYKGRPFVTYPISLYSQADAQMIRITVQRETYSETQDQSSKVDSIFVTKTAG